jgi:hypothetical protein
LKEKENICVKKQRNLREPRERERVEVKRNEKKKKRN